MRPHLIRTLRVVVVTIITVCVSTPLAAQQRKSAAADLTEVQEYRLTSAIIAKLAQAYENVEVLLKTNLDFRKRYASAQDNSWEGETLDKVVERQYYRVPELKRAVGAAGFAPRQFTLASFALLSASFAAITLDSTGAGNSELAPAVRANALFLVRHKAEMELLMTRSRAIERLLDPSAEDDERTPPPADPMRQTSE